MYVQYRLFSERSLWRLLEITKNEKFILAGELKNIICKQSNINYNNKIEIALSLYNEEDYEDGINKSEQDVVFLEAEDKIENGSKVLVHRRIKRRNSIVDISHMAKKEIVIQAEEKQKVQQIPNEFLCKLCNFILNESYIIVCDNNCGYSVCKSCILFYLFQCILRETEHGMILVEEILESEPMKCPVCKGVLKYCILNKKIELTLKKLRDERSDINEYLVNVEERNKSFLKTLEKLKVEYLCDSLTASNLFDIEIFKKIERKYIYASADKAKDTTSNHQVILNGAQGLSSRGKLEEMKLPNHFLFLIDNHKLNCIKEFQLVYIDHSSSMCDSWKNLKEYNEKSNEDNQDVIKNSTSKDSVVVSIEDNEESIKLYNDTIYFIPLSFVGGETSYSLIGVLCLKELMLCLNEKSELSHEVNETIRSFMQKWFNQEKKSVDTYLMDKLREGSIYKVSYFKKYERTCFFPAKKQPIYSMMQNKRQKKKRRSGTEIILDPKKFAEVIGCVSSYIKYGSRPQEEVKRATTTKLEGEESNNLMKKKSQTNIETNFDVGITTYSNEVLKNMKHQIDRDMENEEMRGGVSINECQGILEKLYDTKVVPLTFQKELNVVNPYVGYCSVLPFLTKNEFDFIRKLQRICKEKYLKQLYKHIKKNNLQIDHFHKAVDSIFLTPLNMETNTTIEN